MKSTSDWAQSGNGSNSSGLNVFPAGFRDYGNGNSLFANYKSFLWTRSSSGNEGWYLYLGSEYQGVDIWYQEPNSGFSVRCIKDTE